MINDLGAGVTLRHPAVLRPVGFGLVGVWAPVAFAAVRLVIAIRAMLGVEILPPKQQEKHTCQTEYHIDRNSPATHISPPVDRSTSPTPRFRGIGLTAWLAAKRRKTHRAWKLLPLASCGNPESGGGQRGPRDRKSTRLNSSH